MPRRVALTRRGRAVFVAAMGLACVARLLGLVELYVFAGGAGTLVVCALIRVATRRVDIDVERTLHPHATHAGGTTRVHLRVRNRASAGSPLIALVDPLEPGSSRARFLLSPLGPGATDDADYRLPGERRGVFSIGPLTGDVIDPFGLAQRTVLLAPIAEFVVYPPIERLNTRAHQRGGVTDTDAPHATVRSQSGGEFAGLRAYQVGDDMRRVHWPSTARTGRVMIRQDEVARRGRVTVGIDVEPSAHTEQSFEAALAAGASILAAESGAGSVLRFITNAGHDSGFGSGPAHLKLAFEYLARLDLTDLPSGTRGSAPTSSRSVTGGAATGSAGGEGAVVLITTSASPNTWQTMAALARTPDAVTLVVVDTGVDVAPVTPTGIRRAIHVGAHEPFAPRWDRAAPIAR